MKNNYNLDCYVVTALVGLKENKYLSTNISDDGPTLNGTGFVLIIAIICVDMMNRLPHRKKIIISIAPLPHKILYRILYPYKYKIVCA